jgi:hypothetical protein
VEADVGRIAALSPPLGNAIPASQDHVIQLQKEVNSLKDQVIELKNDNARLAPRNSSHGLTTPLVPLPNSQQATGSGTLTTSASGDPVGAEQSPFRAYDVGVSYSPSGLSHGTTGSNSDGMNAFPGFNHASTPSPWHVGSDSGPGLPSMGTHPAIDFIPDYVNLDIGIDFSQTAQHTATPFMPGGQPSYFGQYSDPGLNIPSMGQPTATDSMFDALFPNTGLSPPHMAQYTANPFMPAGQPSYFGQYSDAGLNLHSMWAQTAVDPTPAAPIPNIGMDPPQMEQPTANPFMTVSPPVEFGHDMVTNGQLNSTASTPNTGNVATNQPRRRYWCQATGCNKSYSRPADRARHARKHNPNATRYTCQHHGCNESYDRKDKLKEHQKNRKH